MKFFRYLFFTYYKWMIALGRKDIPEGKATLLLVLVESFYLTWLLALIEIISKVQTLPKSVFAGVFIVSSVLHIHFLISRRRFLWIYREFKNDRTYLGGSSLVPILVILLPILGMIVFSIIS